MTRNRALPVFAALMLALLAVGLLAAGSATAAGPSTLELKTDKQDLPVGSRVGVEVNFALGLCWSNEAGWGTLTSNGAASDSITKVRESNAGSECTEESDGQRDTETGAIKSVELSANGQATMKLAIRLHIHEAGLLCTFAFGTLHGTFESPGQVYMSGEAVGKLVAKQSGSGCPKTRSTTWWWVSIDDSIGKEAPHNEYVTESEVRS